MTNNLDENVVTEINKDLKKGSVTFFCRITRHNILY